MSTHSYRHSGSKQRAKELAHQCLPLLVGVVLVIFALCAALGWYAISEDKRQTVLDLPEIQLREDQDLVYDLSQLRLGQSRFFTYPVTSSERVRLVLTRDMKGIVRAAFATCPACYSFREQTNMKNGSLVCGRCQQPMRIGEANERFMAGRGCVAVPVSLSADNGKVVVRAHAIVEGAKIFTLVAAN